MKIEILSFLSLLARCNNVACLSIYFNSSIIMNSNLFHLSWPIRALSSRDWWQKYIIHFSHTGPVEWDAEAHLAVFIWSKSLRLLSRIVHIIMAISSSRKEYHISWVYCEATTYWLLALDLRCVRSVIEILTGKWSKNIPRCDAPYNHFINNLLRTSKCFYWWWWKIFKIPQSDQSILWNLRRQETYRVRKKYGS
jgi:hypothetical protein